MLGKLKLVIISDRVNLTSIGGKSLFNALAYGFNVFGVWFGQNRILSFVFYKSGDGALVALAYDGIAFRVADKVRKVTSFERLCFGCENEWKQLF